jgi:hypothetical protein
MTWRRDLPARPSADPGVVPAHKSLLPKHHTQRRFIVPPRLSIILGAPGVDLSCLLLPRGAGRIGYKLEEGRFWCPSLFRGPDPTQHDASLVPKSAVRSAESQGRLRLSPARRAFKAHVEV